MSADADRQAWSCYTDVNLCGVDTTAATKMLPIGAKQQKELCLYLFTIMAVTANMNLPGLSATDR